MKCIFNKYYICVFTKLFISKKIFGVVLNINNKIDEKRARKFFSKIGFSFLALMFFTFFCQFIVGALLQIFPSVISTNPNYIAIISAVTAYILPIPFFLFLMNRFKKYDITKKNMGVLKFIIAIIITFSLTYIGNMIGITLTSFIGGLIGSPISNPVSQMISSIDLWVILIAVVILAPIFEEYFFRKLLIDRTIKYGAVVSIIISATLFAFYHGNFNQFFYAFFIGAFFALIYVKTGRIEYPICLHALVNFFGSVGSISLVSFIEENIPKNINQLNETELIANIADYPGLLLSIGLSFLIVFIIILGVFLIIYYSNKIELPKGEKSVKLYSVFLNGGMLCFLGFYIVMIYFSFFR